MNRQRTALIALFPGLVLLAIALFHGGGARFLPACLIHERTGLHCPGCGGTRAARALAHGDVWQALRMNPFTVVFLVVLGLWALRTSWEAMFPDRRWPRARHDGRWLWTGLALFGVFAITRNLPWWPFTLLVPH